MKPFIDQNDKKKTNGCKLEYEKNAKQLKKDPVYEMVK